MAMETGETIGIVGGGGAGGILLWIAGKYLYDLYVVWRKSRSTDALADREEDRKDERAEEERLSRIIEELYRLKKVQEDDLAAVKRELGKVRDEYLKTREMVAEVRAENASLLRHVRYLERTMSGKLDFQPWAEGSKS